MKIEIACLGENEDIILFQGVGITTFVIKDRKKLNEKIDELAELGTKIILVSDIFNEAIVETLKNIKMKLTQLFFHYRLVVLKVEKD